VGRRRKILNPSETSAEKGRKRINHLRCKEEAPYHHIFLESEKLKAIRFWFFVKSSADKHWGAKTARVRWATQSHRNVPWFSGKKDHKERGRRKGVSQTVTENYSITVRHSHFSRGKRKMTRRFLAGKQSSQEA